MKNVCGDLYMGKLQDLACNFISLFYAAGPFLYPLKTSETFCREFTKIVRSAFFQNTVKCFDYTLETKEAACKCSIE